MRRILAIVLPHLLCELVQQRLRAPELQPTPLRKAEPPRAIVLKDAPRIGREGAALDGKTELDAVNFTAQQLGVRPHQTIAQASAIVDHLSVHELPSACVFSALKDIAEVALGFGSPVSFRTPDTVWVDISGSTHLHSSEAELVLELTGQIKALGHATRAAVATGPWLAQSFARHSQLEQSGILLVEHSHAVTVAGQLPITSLPIDREAVSWFSRLGLLNLEDLRKLPTSSLAARLEEHSSEVALGTILDLIQGRDHGILVPHHPEELPREELFWEDPLENVEPLVFVLKGLAGRLSARLEGRGQAARELLLNIHYDRSIAAFFTPEGDPIPSTKELSFKLASPLFHADDLERVMRMRLLRQSLAAPTLGLSLQATAVTEAKHCQLDLSATADWNSGLCADPRSVAVLVAELSADVGTGSVGLLVPEDSHLLEKSSALQPILAASLAEAADSPDSARCVWSASSTSSRNTSSSSSTSSSSEALEELSLPRVPIRLLDPPIEIHAPIRKHELWVVSEQAFVVTDIHFEQRLEGIEWWDQSRVFRDYFRVWLTAVAGTNATRVPREPAPHEVGARGSHRASMIHSSIIHSRSLPQGARTGIEALAFWDREQGKSFLHALYD